jgi:transposase
VPRTNPRAATKSNAPTVVSLQRTLDAVLLRLARTDKKVEQLEKKVAEVEAERDHYKQLYTEATATIRERDKTIEKLTVRLDCAEKQLAWFKKRMFGKSSEQEPSEDEPKDDGKKVQKKKRGQQPGSHGHGRGKKSKLPSDEQFLEPDNTNCQTCSTPFKALVETDNTSISELETLLYEMKYRRTRYARQCKCPGPRIITAPPPPQLYPRTNIGISLWLHICVQKFLFGTPTNRILKDLALRGLGLATGTVTGGLQVINGLVDPIYEGMKLHCQGESAWNADETGWRVFGENDKKSNKWWLWVIAGKQAVVYILDESRSSRVPSEFFQGSMGVLMTDRFSAYKALSLAITKVWCWVHVRRDFRNLLHLAKFKVWARSWLVQISKMFALNEQRFRLWDGRKNSGAEWNRVSQELEDTVAQMEVQWKEQLQQTLHKEQRKVLNSLRRHWDGLTLFLQDPRIPLDNNRAERLLRGSVVLRKNSYGSGAPWAGHLAAKFFTLFQTWLTNGLDPQALLLDYFNECSLTPGKPPPSVDKFLPWKMSEDRKQDFALPSSYKRPA